MRFLALELDGRDRLDPVQQRLYSLAIGQLAVAHARPARLVSPQSTLEGLQRSARYRGKESFAQALDRRSVAVWRHSGDPSWAT